MTATIPASDVLTELLDQTSLDEPGRACTGFGASELRLSLGGKCWRRMKPYRASRDYGQEYESWEWAGSCASWPAAWLRGRPVRVTRVDVAWDFGVDDSVTADTWYEWTTGYVKARGMSEGVSGQGGMNTRYVGSMQSEKRIRVYRKDWEDPTWAALYGHTLRVELVLKASQARAWWEVWSDNQDRGIAAAGAMIAYMCGLAVCDGDERLPQVELPEASGIAERIVAFVDQYGGMLVALDEAGIPVVSLARERCKRVSRTTLWRMEKLRETVRELGADAVLDLVSALMFGADGAS